MYGWRARVGLIIPADNTVMEPELYGLDLPGISFHVARLTTWKRDEMPACGISLAPLFREMGVDAVVYACAETSFLGGVDANRVIIDQIQQASGLPTITATWAMVEALRAMSLTRIGLVTPYTAPRGAVMEEFLGRNGITVAASHHHDFHAGSDDPREWYPTNIQPPHVVYRLVRALPREGIEGYLLSATNFRTLDVVDQLERDLGVPVVSCNQSIIWWIHRALGLAGPVPGLGRLLVGA
jgi:maleate cis-trans isomerase